MRAGISIASSSCSNRADANFIARYLLPGAPDLDMRVAMTAARIERAFAEAGVDPAPCRAG